MCSNKMSVIINGNFSVELTNCHKTECYVHGYPCLFSAEPSLQLREIVNLLSPHASYWRSIGIILGVPHHELDTIQSDNAQTPDMAQRCLASVLNTYLKQGKALSREDILNLKQNKCKYNPMIRLEDVEMEVPKV